MERQPTSEARLNDIRQYVERGHTYDEAIKEFRCGKLIVQKAVNPEAYERYTQKQAVTKRLITAALAVQKIHDKGFIVSIEGKTIHVLDTKTGLSVKIESRKVNENT